MVPERWELGSDLHRVELTGSAGWPWAGRPHVFTASGREALRQLVAWVRPERVRLPDFFCDDVAPVLGTRIEQYRDDPRRPAPLLEPAPSTLDVRVNTWGLRDGPVATSEGLVEDHTHDPLSGWARSSRAPYAVASLRKALPLADGGVLWSPLGLPLPPELPPSAAHQALAADRWRAMRLKTGWLEGGSGEKDTFRALFLDTEARFAADLGSGISAESREVLSAFGADAWQRARHENFGALAAALGVTARARLLRPAPGARAFAATFELESRAQRDAVKKGLIAERIYPAVLWPLESPELAGCVLSVHCDGRYRAEDIQRAAGIIDRAMAGA